jgi:hypothetical protein
MGWDMMGWDFNSDDINDGMNNNYYSFLIIGGGRSE